MNRNIVGRFRFCRRFASGERQRGPAPFSGSAGADQIEFETVTIRPVQRVQMLDAAAVAIIDGAHEFDQRRAGLDPQGAGDIRGGKTGGNPLRRALDLDAGAFEQFEQRPVGQILGAESHADPLGHVRQQIGKRHAVDRADTDRALQQFMHRRPRALRPRDRSPGHSRMRATAPWCCGPYRRCLPARRKYRPSSGRPRPVDHPRSGAAAPLDQMLALKFAERAAHGDARHAMRVRQVVFSWEAVRRKPRRRS